MIFNSASLSTARQSVAKSIEMMDVNQFAEVKFLHQQLDDLRKDLDANEKIAR